MRVQFLSDGSEYRSYGGGNFSKKTKAEGGLFWWTIGITLLLALATASWFFSILVFAHPEKPMNYKLLAKFNKLEGIRKFTPLTVPHGQFLSGGKLLEEYFYFSADQFRVHNDLLKRNYIKNFKDKNPTYIRGAFEVLAVRKLSAADVFQSGWVLLAQDKELEDVQIEVVMPGLGADAAPYTVGSVFNLDTQSPRSTYASVVHVQRMEGQTLRATLVPLVYQCPSAVDEKAKLAFTPPERLNMQAHWPISTESTPTPASAEPAPETNLSAQASQ
jgi:hypothetical protein